SEGNGEASFTVPCDWENKHNKDKEGQPRHFYLKEKESGEEFPRAYYVKNPNKTDEENKKNSQRIGALMLKVAKSLERDKAQEKSSAVVLGEELPPPEKKTLKEGACPECGKKHVDLRKKLIFKKQAAGSTNCGEVARSIIRQLGITCEGYDIHGVAYYQLVLENASHTKLVFDKGESIKAIQYLDKAIDFGHPVRVGVNHTLGGNINEDSYPTTDHYVVIVGRKCIDGKINYTFWDVGTKRGKSTEWLFQLRDGYKLVADKTYKSGNKPYTVTQIARNIKPNGKIIEY
ncbi:hypothetical protein GO009_17130, partial [Muricauda sp. TY007]|uniref:hypothetical protein n=1 Tax=Allomuricauda sp. TY007 TaxID=2683200 RepID=UPI0013C08E9C